MSYQALLFCPDEKTARVVSQVLSELEFSVEPCNEPFAAVKKLMAQHFDAIVVDCDNEQNAALLFKSARNSGSNQSSLSVAMVEGQTGVAKAFRLGANLVLTKPIHVEQSKATLRVARGLLRKGQTAKPATGVANVPEAMATQHIPIPTQLVAPRAVAAPPVASASFELDAEPTPAPDTVDAALLEYMPDSAPSAPEPSRQTAADSSPSKEYAWQPRSKPMAEPMASALRRAAEAAGKTEFDNPAASHASATHSGSGAAAAPARAREPKVTPLESKSVAVPQQATPQQATPQQVHPAPATETKQLPSAAEIWEAHSPAQAQTPAPRFSSLDAPKDFRGEDASNNGGSKKILLIAVVLLAVAAGYFGWSKMQTGQSQSASHSIAPAETGLASLPPAPAPSAPEVQPSTGQVASQSPEQAASAPGTLASSKPSAGVAAEAPGLKAPAAVTAKAAGTDSAVTTVKPPAASPTESAPALVVNNGVSNQPKTEAAPEPEEAPAPTSIATGADNSALSGLVNTNAINAQKAPQQTLRISQGVSQGLILKKVQPVYPAQALQMRVEGAVELQANISKTGAITGLKQLSGQNILGRAAMDAVKQWKYKPYFLNGEPVEVQTQITVNFKLP